MPANVIRPLTSLRFVAAFIVFLHHTNASADEDLTQAFGVVGVGFFFMLSGLILSHVYHQRLAAVGPRSFYAARIARIMPLHIATALVALALFVPPASWRELVRTAINLSTLHGFFPRPSIYFSLNAPSWSLSVEMFFYATFPLLLPLVLRMRPRSLILSLLAAFFVLLAWAICWGGDHWAVYIFPVGRLPEFFAGMVIWRLVAGKTASPLKATVLEALAIAAMASLFLCYAAIPSALQWTVAYFFPCAFLLAVFAVSNGYMSQLLSWRPLVYLGEISFAFYMVHQLVIRALPEAEFAVWLALTLAAAAAAHHAIEIPCHRLLTRLFPQRAPA